MVNLLFNLDGHEIEVFEFDAQPLFNPYHIGECLDMDNVTVRTHIRGMNQNQVIKLTNAMISISNSTGIRKLNNAGENFLTESGVYQLVLKSKKPSAEKFRNWITDEVLPRIRKYKAFIPGNTPDEIIENGISAMSGMIPLDEYYDRITYHLERERKYEEERNKMYLERFDKTSEKLYGEMDIYSHLLDKSKWRNMRVEDWIDLFIKLGFIKTGSGGEYYINQKKLWTLHPIKLTYRGLLEVCYAFDHPGEIIYHF